jgi:hypothetical protein
VGWRPRHETAATSRKREDIQRSPRPDFWIEVVERTVVSSTRPRRPSI